MSKTRMEKGTLWSVTAKNGETKLVVADAAVQAMERMVGWGISDISQVVGVKVVHEGVLYPFSAASEKEREQ